MDVFLLLLAWTHHTVAIFKCLPAMQGFSMLSCISGLRLFSACDRSQGFWFSAAMNFFLMTGLRVDLADPYHFTETLVHSPGSVSYAKPELTVLCHVHEADPAFNN